MGPNGQGSQVRLGAWSPFSVGFGPNETKPSWDGLGEWSEKVSCGNNGTASLETMAVLVALRLCDTRVRGSPLGRPTGVAPVACRLGPPESLPWSAVLSDVTKDPIPISCRGGVYIQRTNTPALT
jgi:hypothetical protein